MGSRTESPIDVSHLSDSEVLALSDEAYRESLLAGVKTQVNDLFRIGVARAQEKRNPSGFLLTSKPVDNSDICATRLTDRTGDVREIGVVDYGKSTLGNYHGIFITYPREGGDYSFEVHLPHGPVDQVRLNPARRSQEIRFFKGLGINFSRPGVATPAR